MICWVALLTWGWHAKWEGTVVGWGAACKWVVVHLVTQHPHTCSPPPPPLPPVLCRNYIGIESAFFFFFFIAAWAVLSFRKFSSR